MRKQNTYYLVTLGITYTVRGKLDHYETLSYCNLSHRKQDATESVFPIIRTMHPSIEGFSCSVVKCDKRDSKE